MIRSVKIRNFRCFEHINIEKCALFNVIVGDNGSGKTTLLEAIFLALGTSPEIAVRYRQQRGLEGSFSGPIKRVEEALWRDLFFGRDWTRTISIELEASGPDARTVTVFRGQSQLTIPLEISEKGEESRSAPITFQWRDFEGNEHKVVPTIAPSGLRVGGSEEDLPDFFYFPANQPTNSVENAGRFSELSRAGRSRDFVDLFTKEYNWIEDIKIEVLAGAPVVYATLRDTGERLPLAYVSGGINRIVGIMLAIASRDGSVTLVDEMEDGLFYKHKSSLWRGLISLARKAGCQLFLTTHDEEWLEALFKAAGETTSDIALWRLERKKGTPIIHQFSGEQLAAAVRVGEVR